MRTPSGSSSSRGEDDCPELGSPVRLNEQLCHISRDALPLEELAASNYECAHRQAELLLRGAVAPDVIDWAAPGSALHSHKSQQRRTLDTMVQPAAPPPPKQAVRPTTSPGPHKHRQHATQRADRGPQFAFGARDSSRTLGRQIHDSPQVNASLEGPVSKKITKARVAVSSKADPWLSDWQPKPKPASASRPRESLRKPPPVLAAPPLQWDRPAPAPLRKVATQAKGISRVGVLKEPSSSPATPGSASKPASPFAAAADEGMAMSPKQIALRRLEKLRNARRSPIQEPSSPILPFSCPRASSDSAASSDSLQMQMFSPQKALTSATASLAASNMGPAACSLPQPQKRPPKHLPASAGRARQQQQRQPAGESRTTASHVQLTKTPAPRLQKRPVSGEGQELPAVALEADGASAESANLEKCNGCGRTFAPQAFSRHSKICAKVFKKECAAYAAEKAEAQRGLMGSQAASEQTAVASTAVSLSAVSRVAAAPKHKRKEVAAVACNEQAGKAGKLPKWKQQSAQLRAAMLAARPSKLGEAVAAFPGAYTEDESLIPCPHCGRRFAELTAERHIPKCKDTVHKASRLVAGGGRGAHMRRLEAPKRR